MAGFCDYYTGFMSEYGVNIPEYVWIYIKTQGFEYVSYNT